MIENSKRLASTRFWGTALLVLGCFTLSVEIWWYLTTQTWTSMSFIDGIKIGARQILHIRSGEWVYNPQMLLWLHHFLNWLPLTPTLLVLGLIGYRAPVVRKKELKPESTTVFIR